MMRTELSEWEGFVQAASHLLLRRPAVLFQEAANQPDTSAAARAAERRRAAGLEKRPWLRRANKSQARSPCLMTLAGHTGSVSCCAFSPDGGRIVSGSQDGTLRLWNSKTGERLAVLSGHGHNGIERCGFSPDGMFILSSVGEIPSPAGARPQTALMAGLIPQSFQPPIPPLVGDISLWDARSGAHTRAFALDQNARGKIIHSCFSPDGGRVLAGGGEYAPGWLKVWDVATGREMLSVAGKHRLCAAGWSHDGRRILAAWDDEKSLQVLDAGSGRTVMTLQAGFEDPTACACSADGRWILFASYSHLWLWNARTGELAREVQPRALSVQGCAFSPDSSRFVSRSLELTDKAVTLWDSRSGDELAWLAGHAAEVQMATFSPDGSKLATASGDGTLKFWDAASGAELATLEGHGGGVNACALSPDGARIVSASYDKTLKIWDPSVAGATGRSVAREEPGGPVVLCPDGSVATTSSENHPYHCVRIITRWDPDSQEPRGKIRIVHPGRQSSMYGWKFAPDGRVLVSWGTDGESVAHLFLWDARSSANLGEVQGCSAGPFAPDGKRLASGGAHDLQLLDTKSLARMALVEDGSDKHGDPIEYSPDGRLLLCHGGGVRLLIRDGENGTPLLELPQAATPCAFSPDGKQILVHVYFTTRLEVRCATTGNVLAALAGHSKDGLDSCAFSPDGALAITSCRPELKLWDVRSGGEVATLPGETPFAFSPDGRMIALSGGGERLAIWDLARLELLCEQDTGGRVTSIVWRPDSARVVASGGMGRVTFLQLENVEAGPAVVTAWTWGGTCAYRCPACRAWSEAPAVAPGSETRCPRCGAWVRLNRSTIEADWKPIAASWAENRPS